MDDAPKQPRRRWFQFRLSTWLVLVAIIAWVWASQPYFERSLEFVETPIGAPAPTGAPPAAQPMRIDDHDSWMIVRTRMSARLYGPALALAVFLGWKAAWLFAERKQTPATHKTAE